MPPPPARDLTAIGVFQYLVVLAFTAFVVAAVLYLFGSQIAVVFSAPLNP